MRGDPGGNEWVVVLATEPSSATVSTHPLVQGLGVTTFPLFELAVTDASEFEFGERLYVGPGSWDRVERIERRLTYHDLDLTIQSVLWPTVEALIQRNEGRFIEYFNHSSLADRDAHPLSLLPDLTPDCREAIIAARQQGRFADFADLTARVACLEQPQKLLVKRVLLELREGEDAFHWLTE